MVYVQLLQLMVKIINQKEYIKQLIIEVEKEIPEGKPITKESFKIYSNTLNTKNENKNAPLTRYEFKDAANPGKDSMGNYDLELKKNMLKRYTINGIVIILIIKMPLQQKLVIISTNQ